MTGVWILAADHRELGCGGCGHRLWFDGRSGTVAVPDMHDLVDIVDRALEQTAPWLADPLVLDERIKAVARHHTTSPATVALGKVSDGSLGLSFLLWRAARWTGMEVPDTVYASATVQPDGTLGGVRHVDVKCLAVPDGARVLVHPQDVGDVPERCTAVPVATVAEALKAVWPKPEFPHALRNTKYAKRAARFVMKHRGSRPWRALALGLAHQDGSDRLVSAGLAIARRHAGDPVPLADTELAEGVLLADHLQGTADAAGPWKTLAARTGRRLAWKRGPRNGGDAEVFGALGRLYAAWREYDSAKPWLDGAIHFFMEHDPRAASHALCERLRIAGVTGERDDLLVEAAFASLEEQLPRDRHFLQSALLRYAAQCPLPALVDRLEGSLEDGASALWAERCGLEHGRATREEEALGRLHLDPGDVSAIEALRGLPESRVDLERFEELASSSEVLGRVVAWEWRY